MRSFYRRPKIIAMDHGYGGEASFNEAFSFMVYVDSQEEAESWYEKVSAVPEAEICGWAKDQFGISWQIATDFDGGIRYSKSRKGQGSQFGCDDHEAFGHCGYSKIAKLEMITETVLQFPFWLRKG